MDGLFSSESVSEGHPDKIADQIVDALLEAIIAQVPNCPVAAQALVKASMVLLSGRRSDIELSWEHMDKTEVFGKK